MRERERARTTQIVTMTKFQTGTNKVKFLINFGTETTYQKNFGTETIKTQLLSIGS